MRVMPEFFFLQDGASIAIVAWIANIQYQIVRDIAVTYLYKSAHLDALYQTTISRLNNPSRLSSDKRNIFYLRINFFIIRKQHVYYQE